MKAKLMIFLLMAFILSCGSEDKEEVITPPVDKPEWTIPSEEVFDGGPGKDGIPSIDNPQFSRISDIDFMGENDLIIGVLKDGIVKAYPHPILDWHEIVNDKIGNINLAITYCPLTGSAIGWNRRVAGRITEFGVSGKLYNTNLMPYDRITDSYWSQMALSCVNGELVTEKIETYSVIETKWRTWKRLYPNSQIMNTNTGFNRSYGQFPYGDYRTNDNNIIFPVKPIDERLPAKERALGIIGEESSKAYSIESFETAQVIYDVVDGKKLIVIGSKELNFIVAYEDNLNLSSFEINLDNLPVIAIDDDGNELSIDGSIREGPQRGARLNQVKSFIAYWFSLGAFYPGIEIYPN